MKWGCRAWEQEGEAALLQQNTDLKLFRSIYPKINTRLPQFKLTFSMNKHHITGTTALNSFQKFSFKTWRVLFPIPSNGLVKRMVLREMFISPSFKQIQGQFHTAWFSNSCYILKPCLRLHREVTISHTIPA